MDFFSEVLSSAKIWSQVQQYFLNHVLTWAMAALLAVGGVAFPMAHKAAEVLRAWIGRLTDQCALSEASYDYERKKY